MKEKLKIGDKVRWNDPAIEDYEPEDLEKLRNTVYEIVDIYSDETDEIEDDTVCLIAIPGINGETEVYAQELEKINQ